MEVAIWRSLGVLTATFVGGFYYLASKIDALGGRTDSRIDGLDAHLGGRIDAQASAIRELRDDLVARLDEHIGRHAG